MSFVVFVLQLLVWPVVIIVLLVLSVLAAGLLVNSALWVGAAMDRFRWLLFGGLLRRWNLPVAMLLILCADGLLLWYVRAEFGSPVVIISAVLAITGVMVTIINWITNLFAPSLSQGHFDETTVELKKVIEEGNTQVVSAVQVGNAQVVAALSEMTQQMSELSGNIRDLLEARSGDAGGLSSSGGSDG